MPAFLGLTFGEQQKVRLHWSRLFCQQPLTQALLTDPSALVLLAQLVQARDTQNWRCWTARGAKQVWMELRGSTTLWKTDFNRFRFRFFQATDLWQKEIGTCRNLLWRSMGNAFLKHPKKRYPLTGLPIVQLSNEKLSTGNQMSRILWVTYLLNAKFFIGVKIHQTSKLGRNPGISWSPDPKWSELVHAWILIHLYPPNVFLIVQLTGPQVAIDHCEYLCSCAICPVCSRCSWHSVMCIPNAIGFITMAGSGNETCLHNYRHIISHIYYVYLLCTFIDIYWHIHPHTHIYTYTYIYIYMYFPRVVRLGLKHILCITTCLSLGPYLFQCRVYTNHVYPFLVKSEIAWDSSLLQYHMDFPPSPTHWLIVMLSDCHHWGNYTAVLSYQVDWLHHVTSHELSHSNPSPENGWVTHIYWTHIGQPENQQNFLSCIILLIGHGHISFFLFYQVPIKLCVSLFAFDWFSAARQFLSDLFSPRRWTAEHWAQ